MPLRTLAGKLKLETAKRPERLRKALPAVF